MTKFLTLIIWVSFAVSNYVYWEPAIPSPGGTIEIFYDSEEGVLSDNLSSVFIHLGYNGWQDVQDYEMFPQPQIEDGNWFKFIYNIPEDAETVDFVFRDSNGSWDNNGGVGIDWHISLSSFWSPLQPGPNDVIDIVVANSDIEEIAWMVEVGDDNFIIPSSIYWPEGSYVEGNFVVSSLEDASDGTKVLSLGPFDNGQQIIKSIKFISRRGNGEWDQLSNGQLPFYDVYFNFDSQEGDPYVFFLSPSEGSVVSGAVQVMTVGDADFVEYWVNGELVGESSNGPPFSITWSPNNELFGENKIYAIAYGDEDRVSITPLTINIPVSATNQNPVSECDDGLHIDDSSIMVCLYAPDKDYVAIKGSWNTEFPNGELMKLSNNGFWWYSTDLSDGEYSYQFNIDGEKLIADPWSKDVIWKDIIGLNESADFQRAKTNFSIGGSSYDWGDSDYQRPIVNELIIYEMHVGDFGPSENQYGTFEEVTSKIESGYFEQLGINAIELMPVSEFEGSFSWGYNPSFYMAPESQYGTPEDLKRLVDVAHQHGIAILLDVVFNHLWGSSPLFQLYQPLDNYNWQDHDFSNCPYFDDEESLWGYKLEHWHQVSGREYRGWKHIVDALDVWVYDYHIDGFRFDYTPGIGWGGDSNGASFYADYLDNIDSGLILIAEEDNYYQINQTDFDSGWDYSYFHTLDANLLEVNSNGHSWGDMDDLWNHINSYNQGYQDHYGAINYCENHDEGRIIYELTQYQGYNLEDAYEKSKLGSSIVFTSLGIPMIYNGQEFGQNTPHRDDFGYPISPQVLEWSNLDTELGQSLFNHYSKLSSLRKNYDVFNNGYNDVKLIDNTKKSIVYWRVYGDDEIVVAANFDNSNQSINIEFPHNGVWYDYLNDSDFEIESNFYGNYNLPPSSAFIFVSSLPDNNMIGDVNIDGSINVLDIVMIVGCIVGTCQIEDISTGDYNLDGSLNVLDIVSIVNFILNS